MITQEISELLAAPPKRPQKVCAVTFALKSFDEDVHKALEVIIDRDNADVEKLAKFFISKNLDVPINTIRRHRLRLRKDGSGCKCPINE